MTVVNFRHFIYQNQRKECLIGVRTLLYGAGKCKETYLRNQIRSDLPIKFGNILSRSYSINTCSIQMSVQINPHPIPEHSNNYIID